MPCRTQHLYFRTGLGRHWPMNERPILFADSIFDPRIFFTVTLIVIQLSLLTAIGLAGGGFVAPGPVTLERYGALVRALVWDKQEYWRLGSAMFLHGGLFHFLLNATCLYFFGGPVEIALGRWRYLVLYFAAGLTGNLASLLWGEPLGMSVGASGAVFGIVIAYLLIEMRGTIHWTRVIRQPATRLLFFLIGIQLAMGFFLRQIDSMAHWGGALTGATLGHFFVSQMRAQTTRAYWRWPGLGAWMAAFAGLAVLASQPTIGANRHHVQIAFHYFLQGDAAGAMQHFDSATADDPSRAIAALDRMVERYVPRQYRSQAAAALLDLLDADAAALDYYRAQAKRRPSADALWLTATLLQKPGIANYGQALSVWAEAKESYPKSLDWELLEARIHATFRRFDQALVVLDRLQNTSQPLSANHWEIAALCHLRRHEWAEAERATSRCLTAAWAGLPALGSAVHDLTVQEWRCRVLKEMGRTSESLALEAEMEKAWRGVALQSPNDPAALNNLAWHLATHGGDLKEAAELSSRSVALAPEAYNLDTLAWVEHLKGNQGAAWAAMERSLSCRRSSAPEYFYHAGAILDALGNKTEARKFLERAIAPGLDFDECETAQRLVPSESP